MRRRTPKRHGHVGSFPTAGLFVAHLDLAWRDAMLSAEGFRCNDKTPIYRRKDGHYSLRIVWRRREDGMSVVWTETIRCHCAPFTEARQTGTGPMVEGGR